MRSNDDGTPADEDRATRQALIDGATAVADAAVSHLLPEVETLKARLKPRDKKATRLAHTGLPALTRSTNRDEAALRRYIARLQDETTTEDQLGDCKKRLESHRFALELTQLQWSIVKRCHSLVAYNRPFEGSTKESRREKIKTMDKEQQGKSGGAARGLSSEEKTLQHQRLKLMSKVEIIVVDGGAEWLDIRALSAERLATQMSEAGWSWGDHDDTDEDEAVDPDEWETVPLAVQVRKLIEAARLNRHEYVMPRVRVVLPRIARSDNRDVALFLAQLTRMDPSVKVTIDDRDSIFMATPPPPPDEALENLLGYEFAGLTPTLNIDHSILVDLISDITHFRLEVQPWHEHTTSWQIEEELTHEGGVMAKTLYPILAGRRLVCTREAAEHFHELLRKVGTETERERGRLLVPWDEDTRSMTDAEIRARFNELSIRPPPPDVQIPLTILPTHWDEPSSVAKAVEEERVPAVALDVVRCGKLGSSKLSVFMQGWESGDVTVTSNKEIQARIRTWVEANRKSDDEAGPRIFKLDVTRNLLARSATPPEGWWDGTARTGPPGRSSEQ